MIHLDSPELVGPRQRRLLEAAESLGIDQWLLTTAGAVRTATGAWSDSVDLIGEWAWPMVAVGSTVLESACPPDDPRAVDDLLDLLPERGTVAIDRLGQLALERLAERRPSLTLTDAGILMAAAKAPRAAEETKVLVEAHRRTEAILASMIDLVRPGVSERELNAEFAARAAEADFDRLHVDTVFTVLPKDSSAAPWVRGAWVHHAPYRELTSEVILQPGDHVAFDAGIGFCGYTADVGWTLYASDDEPTADERKLAHRWNEVAQRVIEACRPGATVASVRAAALEGWDPSLPVPWPYPLYVAHGVGTELAEPPFIGVEFAPEAETTMFVQSGTVLMVEPYIYEPGVGGYRAEYCIVVGEEATEVASSLSYGDWPQC